MLCWFMLVVSNRATSTGLIIGQNMACVGKVQSIFTATVEDSLIVTVLYPVTDSFYNSQYYCLTVKLRIFIYRFGIRCEIFVKPDFEITLLVNGHHSGSNIEVTELAHQRTISIQSIHQINESLFTIDFSLQLAQSRKSLGYYKVVPFTTTEA
jgi:hypothetical protein